MEDTPLAIVARVLGVAAADVALDLTLAEQAHSDTLFFFPILDHLSCMRLAPLYATPSRRVTQLSD